jgi:hypothetical protein
LDVISVRLLLPVIVLLGAITEEADAFLNNEGGADNVPISALLSVSL